ncbi:MAG TPA: 5-(carboxyamino)imidazole ribonucleotide mutase [Firmicutes bacterium]|nr:5-(carboxyamino)imidazole ribonucleotide mutase [Candidatus Fermentithermobacillaceae bacterium]
MAVEVGVVLGSASDLEKVKPVFEILEQFGIPYDVAVISAHRTPDLVEKYARSVAERGVKVIIAAAGLAAALPGAIAALVDVPVIGLPIGGGPVMGMDALLSITDMPPGVPVAGVGVDSARNAALLAARILAVGDLELRKKLEAYRSKMSSETRDKSKVLREKGLPVWQWEISDWS